MSPREIERLVERSGRFLRAAGTREGGVRELFAAGYTIEDHHEGWGYFLTLCGYDWVDRPATSYTDVKAAIEELDAWDHPTFTRARAALGRLYPEQEAYLFAGLEQQSDVASVAACKRFCDRVAALREGTDPDRAASRDRIRLRWPCSSSAT